MATSATRQDGARHTVDYDPFAGGVLERVVPTTEPQREIWLADRLGREASLAYNESVSLLLEGPLDREALCRAVQQLQARHDALRANFGPDGETLCVGEANASMPVQVHDFGLLEGTQRDAAVEARLRASVETPFELLDGTLFRAELLCLSERRHRLLLSAHHIVCDGWSWWVMVRELGALYARECGLDPGWLPEPDSFADHACALAAGRSAEQEADEAYWRTRFQTLPEPLDLPLDRPRPARRTSSARRYDHVVDASLVSAIRQFGARRGCSLFGTLLAGFAGLMARLTAQDDIVVGIPAAGQSVEGQDQLVGHCVHVLPLRFRADPDAPFETVLAHAQEVLLDALDHPRLTFGSLLKHLRVERDPARLPLVNVMFNIDQALDQESNRFPGLDLAFETNPRAHETFELSVNAVQVDGALRLECQYNTDLFDHATIERWMRAYETLLRAGIEQPTRPFGELGLVDAGGWQALQALQPAPVHYDPTQPAHAFFEACCDAAPERIAACHGDARLTYAELDARANRIAHLLRENGVHAGSLVGLGLQRGTDMLATVLGIWKAGAGYVPLDPAFPVDRLTYMAGDAGLAALVTHEASAGLFDLRGRPVLVLDQLEPALQAMPTTRPRLEPGSLQPDSVAYVIYTSGSTGRPKGVQVPHRAVANLIVAMQREPGLVADDRMLALTTLSFDIAVLELLLPLSVGARVVIAGREVAVDGAAIAALIESAGVTCMQGTPATFRLLLAAGWAGRPGLKALCCGEPLPVDLARDLLPRCDSLWNMYGPTETTVYSTGTRVEPDAAGHLDIHIGTPIANTRVWILDARGQACPLGVPGEICIAGEGVTLGYLGRPELTADRFIEAISLPVRPDGRPEQVYRTGDRGRWRQDGRIEHMGRLDHQVKVRGYRIELGEIESVLAAHPAVARCVVIVREDRKDDARLVAYVVPREDARPDEGALLAHLRQAVPEYMLPQHFVMLDGLPLLPNGKLDRGQLPAPVTGGHAKLHEARPPATAVEAHLAATMADVLGVEAIGVDDDFFASGGHSLLAAQLVARLNRELGANLHLRTLFDAPTVARLAMHVESTGDDGLAARPPIQRLPEDARVPLSPMQERLWVLEQMQPGRVTYNTPSAHRLRGPLDHAAFERAFQAMVCRQATLRTVVGEDEQGTFQRVRDDIDAALPVQDLRSIPEGDRETELRAAMERMIAEPFDLEAGPLFRARLFRLDDEDHVLFFMTHHIIWDGWSFDVFYTEMATLYPAFLRGERSPLPALDVDYRDFTAWYRAWLDGDELKRQLDFWSDHLAGHAAPLQLPLDTPRPSEASGAGGTEWMAIGRATTDRARALATRNDATLFMALLTAYYLLLHRLSGQDDLVVGLPVRNRESEALEPIMGFFVNMLPTRVQVDPDASFLDLLRQVRRAVLDAFSHPDVPFDRLVRALEAPRDPSIAPVYQASFSFQDVRARRTHWGDLEHEHLLVFQKASSGDLGLWFLEHGEGLSGVMTYNTDVLGADSARRFSQRYCRLLEAVLEHPDRPLAALDMRCDADIDVPRQANATRRALPSPATLGSLLDASLVVHGARVALDHAGHSLTHSALHERSLRIAACMREEGVRAGDRVGICMARGPDMLASMLGALRIGAAYVPMDPDYPTDRLQFMVDDAGLRLVLGQRGSCDDLKLGAARRIDVDASGARLAAIAPLAPGTDEASPESVAYVIYTSGSTGKPKGVQVPHRAVVNFLLSMQRVPGLDSDDVLVAVTTTSFDIAVLELFLPLLAGARIVLADRDTVLDDIELGQLIAASGATVMQATPSTWRMLVETGWQAPVGFRALCGGEPLAPDLAESLVGMCAEVWNMYGPTETTVWSTCCRVEADAPIHIGRPIDNTTVHVLDPSGRPCAVGCSGEICIGGAGVSLGYLDRPALTAERFVPDTFADGDGIQGPGLLYRTGDRGRWRHDGTLEHQGRFDHQVKLRGHRIELGEIEAALQAHPAIVRSVVTTHEARPGDVRLVAYVVPQADAPATSALQGHLAARLPAYMLPQRIVVLDTLPLLPNGKIDRNALPLPGGVLPIDAPEVPDIPDVPDALREDPPRPSGTGTPASGLASDTPPRIRYLVQVWEELLEVRVLPTDNFFDLGGHSMLAVKMAHRVSRDTGVRLKLMKLTQLSLAQVAEALPDATDVYGVAASGSDAHGPAPGTPPSPWHRRARKRLARWIGGEGEST